MARGTKRFRVEVDVSRRGRGFEAVACVAGTRSEEAERCGEGRGPTLKAAAKRALSSLARGLRFR
jgi:hypothetical protein